MADAADSKSVARKGVWVRLPPPAPSLSRHTTLESLQMVGRTPQNHK